MYVSSSEVQLALEAIAMERWEDGEDEIGSVLAGVPLNDMKDEEFDGLRRVEEIYV
jgi:predicted aconitase with swiveling domain